ncbi:putative drug exporter of the RND superfamily [Actinopolymorpha cephalotaxi]|uniref:Putative drug exporter of the RND superfamily n=1 Tax=Actinopolymorpha cephalotaxi TaxID=504797 RepID=A0A1I2LU35_9ACTN|nr:MMPL family transporter [Actinopolymorpha cephalotaxi]NYH81429.1 RND superfamily putative drug exporter [Actinopolymorpha cephalotaxi]SFF82118.1 putative drug exporter of the RND superfamily [Actinopolymorpha cephalotaxi]
MAELLYRVGRFAARCHWSVVGIWAAVMLLGLGTFAAFSGTISSAISIPGTPTGKVTDQLARDFKGASGGSGSVAFTTVDGRAFSREQRNGIAGLLERISRVDGVRGVTNPFDTQAQLDSGKAELATGTRKLTQGKDALAKGLEQLKAAQRQLDAQREQAAGKGTPDKVKQRLAAEQEKLDQNKRQLQQQSAKLDGQAAGLQSATQVAELSSGFRFVSKDRAAAVGTVSFEQPTTEVPAEVKTEIEDLVDAAGITGTKALLSQDISQAVPSVLGPGEVAGVIVAAIVLVLMLGTAIGAVLPLASAILGVGVATLAAMSFSGLVDFQSVTPVLGVMLGLAVGIDYSLFILNRHRNQLRQGMDLHESIGLANGTSGNAVVFAGATVVVALLALNITGIPFLGLMGTVGAGAVLVAILVATTFTPAVLSLVGMRVLRKRERAALRPGAASTSRRNPNVDAKGPRHRRADGTHSGADRPMSTRRAILAVVIGIGALAVVALPALQMRLGLPDGASQPEDSQAYQAYEVQAKKFGDGFNGPLLVVANLPHAVDETTRTAEQATVGKAIQDKGDVRAVVPIGVSDDGTELAFQVIPTGGPNSESTADLVQGLRELRPDTAQGGSATLGVAGNASANIDVSQKLSDALPVYLVLVVGLSFLILILVFRSLLVPLTATIGFVLSLLGAFGGITAIFQLGWVSSLFGVHSPGPILSFLPIIQTGILFGLAMDYQLFLVSGMREAYAHGAPAKVAVRRGLHAGRSVVTAAAIIMISVFAGFIFSHDTTIKPIGFGLAFGVLLDAFVVRMLIIPAAMHLIGDKAWWIPRWLDRILPDVDVEGAKLERTHPVSHHPADVVPAPAPTNTST